MTADATVRRHLFAVVEALRGEPAPAPERAASRARMLDLLEAYARAGRFPRHDRLAASRPRPTVPARAFLGSGARTPSFRDARGTWCAVGHLIAATDPALARSVARRFPERWLAEMDEPALIAWAYDHGLRLADLEWIQPAYVCDYMEHCDTVEHVRPDPYSGPVCEGPEPEIPDGDEAVTWCSDCDGNVSVWVWVHNRGDEISGDVTVQLYGYDVGVYEIEVIDEIVVTGLVPRLLREVGPLSGPGSNMRGVRLVTDQDCLTGNEDRQPPDWQAGFDPVTGWQLPKECIGPVCDPADRPGDRGCDGCAPTSGLPGVGALGALAFATLAGRRRRAVGGGVHAETR